MFKICNFSICLIFLTLGLSPNLSRADCNDPFWYSHYPSECGRCCTAGDTLREVFNDQCNIDAKLIVSIECENLKYAAQQAYATGMVCSERVRGDQVAAKTACDQLPDLSNTGARYYFPNIHRAAEILWSRASTANGAKEMKAAKASPIAVHSDYAVGGVRTGAIWSWQNLQWEGGNTGTRAIEALRQTPKKEESFFEQVDRLSDELVFDCNKNLDPLFYSKYRTENAQRASFLEKYSLVNPTLKLGSTLSPFHQALWACIKKDSALLKDSDLLNMGFLRTATQPSITLGLTSFLDEYFGWRIKDLLKNHLYLQQIIEQTKNSTSTECAYFAQLYRNSFPNVPRILDQTRKDELLEEASSLPASIGWSGLDIEYFEPFCERMKSQLNLSVLKSNWNLFIKQWIEFATSPNITSEIFEDFDLNGISSYWRSIAGAQITTALRRIGQHLAELNQNANQQNTAIEEIESSCKAIVDYHAKKPKTPEERAPVFPSITSLKIKADALNIKGDLLETLFVNELNQIDTLFNGLFDSTDSKFVDFKNSTSCGYYSRLCNEKIFHQVIYDSIADTINTLEAAIQSAIEKNQIKRRSLAQRCQTLDQNWQTLANTAGETLQSLTPQPVPIEGK